MRLHPCDELLPRGPPISDMRKGGALNWSLDVDNNCLDLIAQHYVVSLQHAGTGAHGAVLKLSEQTDPHRQIAVKILHYQIEPNHPFYANETVMRDAQRELFIACQLNALETQIFTKTFGWLVCNRLPPSWTKYVDIQEYANAKKVFIFMESNPLKIQDKSIRLDQEDYLLTIFLLLHGLYVARRDLGFKHNDLHIRNLMFSTSLSSSPSQQITIEGQTFHIPLTHGFYPKVIDFRQTRNDVAFVFDILERRARHREETLPTISGLQELYDATQNGEYQPIADFLLQNEAFKTLRVTKKARVERVCFFCGTDSSLQWENNDERTFCSHGCGLRLSKIAVFL